MANRKYYWATINTTKSDLQYKKFYDSKAEAITGFEKYAQNIIDKAISATQQQIIDFVKKSHNNLNLRPIKFNNEHGQELVMFQLGVVLIVCKATVQDIMLHWNFHYKLKYIKE